MVSVGVYAKKNRMLAAKHIDANARGQGSYLQTDYVCSEPTMSTGPVPSGEYSAKSIIKVS